MTARGKDGAVDGRQGWPGLEGLLLEAIPSLAVVQVRFPFVPEIQHPASAGGIRRIMGEVYPSLSMERTRDDRQTGDDPPPNVLYDLVWNLSDGTEGSAWSVTLGADSVSLETSALCDRQGLLDRTAHVVSKVRELFSPACCSRVGLRFFCEVDASAAEVLIRPEFLGIHRQFADVPLFAGSDGASVQSSTFRTADSTSVKGRWGLEGGLFEAGQGSPTAGGPRWAADVDLFRSEVSVFDEGKLTGAVGRLADGLGQMLSCMVSDRAREADSLDAALIASKVAAGERQARDCDGEPAVAEIRRLSGLGWDEIADLLGASVRSVHNWAAGRKTTRDNQDVIRKVLAAVRVLSERAGDGTRPLLLEVNPHLGRSRFDLLKERRYAEAVSGLGDLAASGSAPGAEARVGNGAGVASATSTGEAVREIHRLSGLSWDRIAGLFGVSVRSIHNWARNRGMSRASQVLVYRMLAAVRRLDRGSRRETRRLLLEAGPAGGESRFEMLKARRFDEAGAGLPRRNGLRPRLRAALYDIEARECSPEELPESDVPGNTPDRSIRDG